MESNAELGVVIPSYKEAENIGVLLLALEKVAPGVKIVVVDDSPDLSTVQAVHAVALPDVEVIHREGKGGRGSAVLLGIHRLLELNCQRIVEMDADLSHPPEQMPQLLAQAEADQADLLIASRYLPDSQILDWPQGRRLFSRFANIVARLLLQVPITDYTNGYRVYSRKGAEVVDSTCGHLGRGFVSLSEILVNLYYRGYRVSEQSTIFRNRLRGESSVTATEIYNAATGLMRILFLKLKLERTQR